MRKKGILAKILVTVLAGAAIFGLPAEGMSRVYAAESVLAVNKKKEESTLDKLKKKFEEFKDGFIKTIEEYQKSKEKRVKELADATAKALKDFAYDIDKTLEENREALQKMVDQFLRDIDVFHLIYKPEKASYNGVYCREWVKGKWYNSDGTQTYKPTGKWMKNSKGWWYQDTSGWYPKSTWQKINGVWYYFKYDGYMAESEYCNGYWLDRSGAWTYTFRAAWHRDTIGWWYGDASKWYAKDATYIIDGRKCIFDKDGYLINK